MEERNSDDAQRVCVVIDTNSWRENDLLRSASGAALLYYLRQTNGCLGMPEILEREWKKHAKELIRDAVNRLRALRRKLELMVGQNVLVGTSRTSISSDSGCEIAENLKAFLSESH